MKKLKLIICQGAPASGKTTWSKDYIITKQAKGDFSWVRLNRDDLRKSTGVNYHFKNEKFITNLELNAIRHACANDLNIISDNTNLNPTHLEKLVSLAQELELDIEYQTFNISFEEALIRDSKRENPVGKRVLKSFFHKYYQGFDKKFDERNYVKYDEKLPNCIICDLDGTLSLMNGRSPYKGEDCASDLVNTPVLSILRIYKLLSANIILLSGRNGESKPQTEEWLKTHDIEYDFLYMREPKNQEKDSELKERLYNQYIKNKYNVLFVLDDRDQVVKKWRELGLPCFQVWYGNF